MHFVKVDPTVLFFNQICFGLLFVFKSSQNLFATFPQKIYLFERKTSAISDLQDAKDICKFYASISPFKIISSKKFNE